MKQSNARQGAFHVGFRVCCPQVQSSAIRPGRGAAGGRGGRAEGAGRKVLTEHYRDGH